MREPLREVAVIRENEESFALGVEPANIEKPRELWRQQIEDRVPRVRILSRGNKTRGFVERDMKWSFRADKFAPDFDVIVLRWLHAEVGAHPAVNRDLA